MKTILVVDDEVKMLDIYKTLLNAEGYNVIKTADAIDANEILKKEPIDLVLLDLRMPEISGNILFDMLQSFHKNTKVLVSSVFNVEKQKKIVRGASDYYDKSQGVEVLLNKVNSLLQSAL